MILKSKNIGITVQIGGGIYHLNRTFQLTTADSGTATAPIVYLGSNQTAGIFFTTKS